MYYAYLIELSHPLGSHRHTARYYLGIARDVAARLAQHQAGQGSKMLAAAVRRAIAFSVVRWWRFPNRRAAAAFEEWAKKSIKNHRLLLSLKRPPLLA